MVVHSETQEERGCALVAAHARSLDPDTPTARERLEELLGPELTGKLLFALAPGSERDRCAVTGAAA
jgi:hypothetical protein